MVVEMETLFFHLQTCVLAAIVSFGSQTGAYAKQRKGKYSQICVATGRFCGQNRCSLGLSKEPSATERNPKTPTAILKGCPKRELLSTTLGPFGFHQSIHVSARDDVGGPAPPAARRRAKWTPTSSWPARLWHMPVESRELRGRFDPFVGPDPPDKPAAPHANLSEWLRDETLGATGERKNGASHKGVPHTVRTRSCTSRRPFHLCFLKVLE